ncbi:MAG TPA: 4-alpha-glucanotransferase, partial [Acidimicrobiales bacterium]
MEAPRVDAWSIAEGYWDTDRQWHATADEARQALRVAMGADGLDQPAPGPPLWFVRGGDPAPLNSPCELVLEDSSTVDAVTTLPGDLPFGYHTLVPVDGGPPTSLVVTPRRCPPALRTWGWAAQLYALRSSSSWGHGDLGDLAELARWTTALGGGIVMINPLHATYPNVPQQNSPYFSTSRLWRSTLYLRIGAIPGAVEAGFGGLDDQGRALNRLAHLDRDEVFRLKDEALRALFALWHERPDDAGRFSAWRGLQGVALERFAVWSAIAETHGPDTGRWPAELRHPSSPAVRTFAFEHADRATFHAWCQWHLDGQLAAAARA